MGALDVQLAAAMQKALEELQAKTLLTVQYETAITWGGRALAAYAMYSNSGSLQDLLAAEEYAHESLEHAALAGPHVYGAVLECLHKAKVAVSAVPPMSE